MHQEDSSQKRVPHSSIHWSKWPCIGDKHPIFRQAQISFQVVPHPVQCENSAVPVTRCMSFFATESCVSHLRFPITTRATLKKDRSKIHENPTKTERKIQVVLSFCGGSIPFQESISYETCNFQPQPAQTRTDRKTDPPLPGGASSTARYAQL